MRSPWIISVILAASLAPLAIAQNQQKGVDPNTKQQNEKLVAAFSDKWGNQDATGLAALFTPDGVLVTSSADPVCNGPQQIAAHYQNVFKQGVSQNSPTVDQIVPLGDNAVILVGEYHVSGQGQNGPIKLDGHYSAVDVLDGGTWKIKLLSGSPNPPPAPAR
jgi:uncharacterized protein (TIGR02246 family)